MTTQNTIDLWIKFKGKYEIFKDYNWRPWKKIAETKNDIQWWLLDYFNTRFLYRSASWYNNSGNNHYRWVLYSPRLFLWNDNTAQTRFDADDWGNWTPKQLTENNIWNNANSALWVVKWFVQWNFSKNSSYWVQSEGNKRRCLFTCDITQDFTLAELWIIARMYDRDYWDSTSERYYLGVSRATLDTPIDVVNWDTIHIIYTIEFDTSSSQDWWYLVWWGKWIDGMIWDGDNYNYNDTLLLNKMWISTDSTHLDPTLQPYDTTGYLTHGTNFVGYETVETSWWKNIRWTIWECTISWVPADTYGNITFFWLNQSFLRKEQTLQVDTDNSNVYFKIRVYFW